MRARRHVIAFTCAIAGAASAQCCAAANGCKGRNACMASKPEKRLAAYAVTATVRRVYHTEPGTTPSGAVLEVDVTAVERGTGLSAGDLLYVRAKQPTALPAAGEKVQLAFDRAADGGHDLAGEWKEGP